MEVTLKQAGEIKLKKANKNSVIFSCKILMVIMLVQL